TGVLAAILVWWPESIYVHYTRANEIWGITPRIDQQVAGALMMVLDMVAALWATTWIALGTLKRTPARQAQAA
ncbi:MAG: cytochrome c oxidase assembly protein, partial [Actinobacteria bacterium]|nr:cytochrome c oxidase assembly protein [Actinomycetota bacterium]